MARLSQRDLRRLQGVHTDLVRVIFRAAEQGAPPFMVLEGLRTIEKQQALYDSGASTTMNSRHLTGHAVDIAPLLSDFRPTWHWPHYHALAPHIKQAAAELEVPIEWGGDWKKFPDGPHWQLPWLHYPLPGVSS